MSVKLTQMGLDIDPALCRRNVRADSRSGQGAECLRPARHGRVAVHPEDARLLSAAALCSVRRECRRRAAVGIASHRRRRGRHDPDQNCRVRLCKGAYLEKPDVAYPRQSRSSTANISSSPERLITDGNYPGHRNARRSSYRQGLKEFATASNDSARPIPGFQMLYGVRRDLPGSTGARGYRMRVYIPFGTQWYPYLDAAPCRAAGQHRLHSRPRDQGRLPALVSEFTLGGYMAALERCRRILRQRRSRRILVALWIDDEPTSAAGLAVRCCLSAGIRPGDAPDGHHESDYLVWGTTARSGD